METRVKIFIVSAFLLIATGVVFIFFWNDENDLSENATAKIYVQDASYDFGNISMANGPVSHYFELKNDGNKELKISGVRTSCMCTTATLEINGEKSPTFGMHNNPAFWKGKLMPGESAKLNVIFDPNAHGPSGTGPINRQIIMETDSENKNSTTLFTIIGNVTK